MHKKGIASLIIILIALVAVAGVVSYSGLIDKKIQFSGGSGVEVSDDGDGDGWYDDADNCPSVFNPGQEDEDGDGIGDACQQDDDGDGIMNPEDPDDDNDGTPDEDEDLDGDGNPNDEDGDDDGDFVQENPTSGESDNCPGVFNPDQADSDGDGDGDACEDDDDDNINADDDNCPSVDNPDQIDTDGVGVGDACDNCVDNANADQENDDGDAVGNVCEDNDGDGVKDPEDPDDDNDGDEDTQDNCALVENADQRDTDSDGVGDACDNCDDVANADQLDNDADGEGNACENPTVLCKYKCNQVNEDLVQQWLSCTDGYEGNKTNITSYCEEVLYDNTIGNWFITYNHYKQRPICTPHGDPSVDDIITWKKETCGDNILCRKIIAKAKSLPTPTYGDGVCIGVSCEGYPLIDGSPDIYAMALVSNNYPIIGAGGTCVNDNTAISVANCKQHPTVNDMVLLVPTPGGSPVACPVIGRVGQPGRAQCEQLGPHFARCKSIP